MNTLYSYVGPADVKNRAMVHPGGRPIRGVADLLTWIRDTDQRSGTDGLVIATFVINPQGILLIADRRSEHVACAAGGPVLSAGEMFFRVSRGTFEVAEVSNQSTGFCPEPSSWPLVAAALDRIGIAHPGRFTTEVVFRRCPKCGERNVVKEEWFVCVVCGADLPERWKF